jgi:hypothetical protein
MTPDLLLVQLLNAADVMARRSPCAVRAIRTCTITKPAPHNARSPMAPHQLRAAPGKPA